VTKEEKHGKLEEQNVMLTKREMPQKWQVNSMEKETKFELLHFFRLRGQISPGFRLQLHFYLPLQGGLNVI